MATQVRTRARRALLGVVTGSALALGAVAGAPASGGAEPVVAAAAPVSDLRLGTTLVRGGFDSPTQVTSADDRTNRLFVVEQGGRIRAVTAKRTWTYLNLRSRVQASGEQGLLGLAFSPRFSKDKRLYVSYTRGDGALVIARVKAKKVKARKAKLGTLTPLLVVKHPDYTNHNGGALAFGPDGFLYIGTGDGGGGGDPRDNARKLSSLSGKILRIDVTRSCGKRQYCIPASNPYKHTARAKPQILHRGVRNPWRISFDPAGRLWIGDVGQSAYEEIDVLPRGARGLDLGWPCREGRHSYDASRCRSGASYTGPVVELGRDVAQSITGGYVYRGSRYPGASGAYVFSDWASGNVWAYRDGSLARIGSLGNVTSFGEDDAGELYAVTSAGELRRLVLRTA